MWIVDKNYRAVNANQMDVIRVEEMNEGGAITMQKDGQRVARLESPDIKLLHYVFDDIVYGMNVGYNVCMLDKAESDYYKHKAKREVADE